MTINDMMKADITGVDISALDDEAPEYAWRAGWHAGFASAMNMAVEQVLRLHTFNQDATDNPLPMSMLLGEGKNPTDAADE